MSDSGKFSCAVDCFLELCFFVFQNHLHNIALNEFFQIVHESCNARQILGVVEDVRDPLWSWIRNHKASFFAMIADAVFSDIFSERTFGRMTDELKSFFILQQYNQSSCTLCRNQIVKNTDICVLYITSPRLSSIEFESSVSEAFLPNTRALYCDVCQKHSGDVSELQHFVILPTFLKIELSSHCIDHILFPLTMEVLENFYLVKAVVRCSSQHFTIKYLNTLLLTSSPKVHVTMIVETFSIRFFAANRKPQTAVCG